MDTIWDMFEALIAELQHRAQDENTITVPFDASAKHIEEIRDELWRKITGQ